MYPKGCKSGYNRYLHILVYYSTIAVTKLQNQPKCPTTDEWINKENVVCTHYGILFSHKEEQKYVI
jgi:hypothetical protein